MTPSDARHALQTRAHISPLTPDLTIVVRSAVILNGQPYPFRSHRGVSESSAPISCGLITMALLPLLLQLPRHLTPPLAHPSRVSHKPLYPEHFSACDLAVIRPRYGSSTNRSTIGRSTLIRRVSSAFRRLPEPWQPIRLPFGVYWVQVAFQTCFEPRQWPDWLFSDR
jgi:hypothetical protein